MCMASISYPYQLVIEGGIPIAKQLCIITKSKLSLMHDIGLLESTNVLRYVILLKNCKGDGVVISQISWKLPKDTENV